MHRFAKQHVTALAEAIAGVVMPRSERTKLTGLVVDLLADTAPQPTAKRPEPKDRFTGRDHYAFTSKADPDSGSEIVATVVVGESGRVEYESWALHVTHPDWGLSIRDASSFAHAVELAWKEEFCRNPAAIPVRIDKM